jgi:hypothetical protein
MVHFLFLIQLQDNGSVRHFVQLLYFFQTYYVAGNV